ncbi:MULTISPECIES: hypothetical protein [Amycolatopsis]|uniref:Uncharacterized protein n=1 Tax=Amycolatopsis albidoflavus TaxID=102226 RepID=A0ABW5HZT3_9PSEU
MEPNAADLVAELKVLRKGRGVFTTPLGIRVGPVLREVCGIPDNAENVEIRDRLAHVLEPLAKTLPDDLRIAVLAAFAMHEPARKPFYQERVHWAARELDRDDRTIRRRIDEGIEHVAHLALAGPREGGARPAPDGSWHTELLRVSLALDQDRPEVFEFRRIVADADEIAELDLALTLTTTSATAGPVRESDLDVDVFHGGTLVRRAMESNDRVGLALQLADPLPRGKTHDLALRFRAEFRHPHYVCVPRHPVDRFDLHVRFPAAPPTEIVRLDRVFQDDARDPGARGAVVSPDGSGEVHLRFDHLAPGFAYGIRWNPAG